MVRASIWLDVYYTSSEKQLVYYIEDENQNRIFAGRAYRLPTETEVEININSICRNYLYNDIRPLFDAYDEQGTTSSLADGGIAQFKLYDGDDNLLETYEFLYDWSYDTIYSGSNMVLSRPINGRITSGVFPITSKIVNGEVYNYLTNVNGLYSLADDICNAEWAIYYLNSYGGWDAFVFEGNGTKTDTITQWTTDRPFRNNTLDFENYRYVSEINTSYTIYTGWLNDEQSENFAKNLVGSNNVYLQNLKTGKMFSAVITDTKVTYQQMKTNKGKMACYALNIKESQNKLRQ